MARIRTIKPEYWTDEAVGECSVSARLLFIACWNFADDQGGLDRSAKQLKAQAFPYDVIDCEPLVQELIAQGLLIEYEANGRKYLHINNFLKHQKIDNPAKPRIPPYEGSPDNGEPSPSPPRGLAAEGKGRESKGKEQKAAAPRGADAPVELHESLPKEVWAEWLEHRRRKRWPMDSTTLRKQLAVLAGYDASVQRQMLDGSMQAGWQGVFPLKGGEKRGPTPEDRKAEMDRECQRLRERRDREAPEFRDPFPRDTPASYETALRTAINQLPRSNRAAPIVTDLAKRLQA